MKQLFVTLAILVVVGCSEKAGKHQHAKGKPIEAHAAPVRELIPAARDDARANYLKGDYRVIAYGQNGLNSRIEAPGVPRYIIDYAGRDDALKAVTIRRDKSKPLNCTDCDYPMTSEGKKQVVWYGDYNTEICRLAAKDGLPYCGLGKERKGPMVGRL